EVAGAGRALVLAIHQLRDAARVCDRFVLLAEGRVRGVGTLAELQAQTGKAAADWRAASFGPPETAVAHRAPMRPLLGKELWEVASGRALWTMLLILCPLLGYSFFQAVSLYDEASKAAAESPVLGSGLSPLDGVLVPTFGGLYLA